MGGGGRKPGFHHDKKTREKISKARQGHGAYALIAGLKRGKKVIDRRTKLGRAILDSVEQLKQDLGGELTQSQLLILDRIIEQLAVLHLISSYAFQHSNKIIGEGGEIMPCLGRSYLAWEAELRRNLQVLQELGKKQAGGLDYKKYITGLKTVDSGDTSRAKNSG